VQGKDLAAKRTARWKSCVSQSQMDNHPIYWLQTAGEMAEWLKAAVC